MKREQLEHEFGPVYDEQSRVLILGSFPSLKSRQQQFYYAHPRNRFWPLIARITESELPRSIAEKEELLHRHHIALWDVIGSCSISGSSDASIEDVRVNDLARILDKAPIRTIYLNGSKAYDLYARYLADRYEIEAVKLPSTSPANAAFSLERLYLSWQQIKALL